MTEQQTDVQRGIDERNRAKLERHLKDKRDRFAIPDLKDWNDLAVRLRQYALAVSSLGGLNDLDRALYMAADGVERYAAIPEEDRGRFLVAQKVWDGQADRHVRGDGTVDTDAFNAESAANEPG
jgi:hypothetical protein